MSLLRQSRGLVATQAAAAVRSLVGAAGPPAPHSALQAVPSHSSRGMSTAAASSWAPAQSPPGSVTAALSAATGFVSEWTQRISIWLAAPKSKVTQNPSECYTCIIPCPYLWLHQAYPCLSTMKGHSLRQNPLANARLLACAQRQTRRGPRHSLGSGEVTTVAVSACDSYLYCAE